jgi:NDP-sugar pyrophosphorylase family protein
MFDHKLKILEKKTNVLILCGGIGNRIKKITKKIPKPLIEVNKNPFLFYILKNLERYNYKKIYLLTYYKNNQFKRFLIKYIKQTQENQPNFRVNIAAKYINISHLFINTLNTIVLRIRMRI